MYYGKSQKQRVVTVIKTIPRQICTIPGKLSWISIKLFTMLMDTYTQEILKESEGKPFSPRSAMTDSMYLHFVKT